MNKIAVAFKNKNKSDKTKNNDTKEKNNGENSSIAHNIIGLLNIITNNEIIINPACNNVCNEFLDSYEKKQEQIKNDTKFYCRIMEKIYNKIN